MTTTIVLSNVPADLFARLSAQAARSNRTVEEVCLARLATILTDRPGDQDTGPVAFARPLPTSGVRVAAPGGERLPALPVILDPTPG